MKRGADYGWPPRLLMRLACEYTGRSRWCLARAARDGKLAVAGRNGRTLVFDRSALDAFLVGDRTLPASNARKPEPLTRRATALGNALGRLAAIRQGVAK